MENKLEILLDLIKNSNNIVFFGGAGVSTESNIPDFRSENGIFNTINEYGYSPETILSHSFFKKNPEIFFEYYKKNLIFLNAIPNDCHLALTKLENLGKLKGVITQNIDNLHQKANTKNVIELHGTLYKNYCLNCNAKFDINYAMKTSGITFCDKCGGIVRPDVVLYEEPLNENTVENAINLILNCDLLIVGGTSLNVYPAASFLNYYKGRNLILINKSKTPYDYKANLIINENIGEVFKKIMKKI